MTTTHALTADPLDILLKHNLWATRQVLDFCAPLTPDQFHQRFEIGLGSLHDALTHTIGAMRRWADRIDGRTLRPSIEIPAGSTWTWGGPATQGPKPPIARHELPQLVSLLNEAAADLTGVADRARARGLNQAVTLTFPKGTFTLTLGGALTHVTTHGHHHRAQCINILRRLNAPAFAHGTPELGVMDWQVEGEPA
ncbi:MAG: DinB family protein [Phycisphaerales bacterium]|nr:DinB family protein [Phycisphaerales bacterium]